MSDKISLGNGWWTDQEGMFKWQYEVDEHTYKNVTFLGKFPIVSSEGSTKKGYSWVIIFPGTYRLAIPKAHVNLRNSWKSFRSSVNYAVRAFESIESGFDELQQKVDCTESSVFWGRAHNEDPYWVCAVFKNRKHIPLPILLRWMDHDGKISGGFIQQLAVLIAGYLYPDHLIAALEACAVYISEGGYKFEVDTPPDVRELLGETTLRNLGV